MMRNFMVVLNDQDGEIIICMDLISHTITTPNRGMNEWGQNEGLIAGIAVFSRNLPQFLFHAQEQPDKIRIEVLPGFFLYQ